MNVTLSRVLALTFILIAASSSGCGKKEHQYAVEARTAHEIIGLLKWYELERPGDRVTNLSQIFALLPRKYPYDWDRTFRHYGSDAGFRGSIFEKYVFLPSGITNRFVHGEVLALNAKPFPTPEGASRIVISRVGTGFSDYRRWQYPETEIQKLFAEAGVQIPKPLPSPPPPPPPEPSASDKLFGPTIWSKTSDFFDAVAALLGLGVERGGLLQWWTFAFVATVGCACVAWGLSRWIRRRHN